MRQNSGNWNANTVLFFLLHGLAAKPPAVPAHHSNDHRWHRKWHNCREFALCDPKQPAQRWKPAALSDEEGPTVSCAALTRSEGEMPVAHQAWDVCVVARGKEARVVAALRAAHAGSMCRKERLRRMRWPGEGRRRGAVRLAPAEEKVRQAEGRK